jgi:hypothetical protein
MRVNPLAEPLLKRLTERTAVAAAHCLMVMLCFLGVCRLTARSILSSC